MKFLVTLLLIALLAFAAGLYLPWWAMVITSLMIAVIIPLRPWQAFLAGFAALFLLWGGLAWCIDIKNQGILSHKIALLLPLGGSAALLILVTAFAGALLAGMGALTGSLWRRLL